MDKFEEVENIFQAIKALETLKEDKACGNLLSKIPTSIEQISTNIPEEDQIEIINMIIKSIKKIYVDKISAVSKDIDIDISNNKIKLVPCGYPGTTSSLIDPELRSDQQVTYTVDNGR